MPKVLVIDESELIRSYLKKKLEAYGMEVIVAVNGFDGMIKMKNNLPDLIIMDYYLSRVSSLEILKEKKANPNTTDTPLIMATSKIDRPKLLEIARYNVSKFFAKPIKMDALIEAVASILGMELKIDSTPCIIEAHFNDEMLFIEIARGLNREKIDLLKYKIKELLELYKVKVPKVLIIMSDIQIENADTGKLKVLFENIVGATRSPAKAIKILTSSQQVKAFIQNHSNFGKIEITDSLSKAMDGLLGIKVSDFIDDGMNIVKSDFLVSQAPRSGKDETIQLRFAEEMRDITIGVIDDDLVIQELIKTAFSNTDWRVKAYENGRKFVDDLGNETFDLIFLDLLMPVLDGFGVLAYLKEKKVEMPVIVLSAVKERDTVVRAIRSGARSYLTKPISPGGIFKKTTEILKRNF